MDQNVSMSVSQILRDGKGNKTVFVEFIREKARAEGRLVIVSPAPKKPAGGALQDFTPRKKTEKPGAAPKKEEITATLLSCTGFSEEEKSFLEEYLQNSREEILSLARKVDPFRSFLGKS